MKKLGILFSAVITVILLSCNQGGRNVENNENAKDPNKNAILIEDAKVEGEAEGETRRVEDSVRMHQDSTKSMRDTLNR